MSRKFHAWYHKLRVSWHWMNKIACLPVRHGLNTIVWSRDFRRRWENSYPHSTKTANSRLYICPVKKRTTLRTCQVTRWFHFDSVSCYMFTFILYHLRMRHLKFITSSRIPLSRYSMSIISTTSMPSSRLLEDPWDSSLDSHSTQQPSSSSTDWFKCIYPHKNVENTLSRRSQLQSPNESLCTWFGEFCSCCCLPLLPQLACSILATWERPYNEAQYDLQARSIYLIDKPEDPKVHCVSTISCFYSTHPV